MTLTPVWENYLKVILELYENRGVARVTDIAEIFGVTKATVSKTVKKLIFIGLVQKEKYGPIWLTDSGKAWAVTIRNRNIIIKDFLIEVLGIDSKVSEKDACMMEHVISSQALERIEAIIKKL